THLSHGQPVGPPNSGDRRRVIRRAEDRGAGDDRIRARFDRLSGAFAILSAIDLDNRVESARVAKLAQSTDLRQHLRRNFWPPKPGLTVMTRMTSQRWRTYSISSVGLAGSSTTPTFLPRSWICERTRCRWTVVDDSAWTRR